uniref:TF-B3 domain-containing protein n=1 Tax=Setaria viridis TaxID=4556 RepID=A0A4U6SWL0_SETVI|nr:B3 domain-containing protein Os03g0619600-like [Setaria viridis]TKV92493.1 hypothetical protein SEVIR_9G164800v2 [Setaria viridis]
MFLQDTVCEVCGNIGYKHLLVCCRDCKCSAVHLYCLDKVIFDASLAEWWCDECLQRRGEVPCSRSLERVSSQRSPNHDHFGSTVQQQVTKRVKSAKNAGPRRKSKAEDIPSAKYSLDSDDLQASSKAHYVLSYRSYLSEAQKQRVMAFIKEIQPKITVFVAVMLKRNVQPPGPFLELGVRYAAAHLPASGQAVALQCMGKTWITQMVIHNGRRWFLNGGWVRFARDNGLRVGDICLFELKKNKRKLTMKVHIISREQSSLK